MLNTFDEKLISYKHFSLILMLVISFVAVKPAQAITGGEVLNKMNAKEQSAYLAGVVSGMAQAKWLTEKPSTEGMDCINGWYFNGGEKRHKKINAWFERHADKSAAGLLYILIKKECGDLIG